MNLSTIEILNIARSQNRPTSKSYIEGIFSDICFFNGDRRFGIDSAILGGIGFVDKTPVTFIGIEKGTTMKERIECNFGSVKPEGYRMALRLMKQAEKFNRPIVTFVDTAGAFCGEEAENRGQASAIAENLFEMSFLKVPIISIIIGEGGSGGALGIAVANKVYILKNAIYSVISPEGCASILYKDSKMVSAAADSLKITSRDMLNFKIVNGIIDEDFNRFSAMLKTIKELILEDIEKLQILSKDELCEQRYNRFRKIGYFNEKIN